MYTMNRCLSFVGLPGIRQWLAIVLGAAWVGSCSLTWAQSAPERVSPIPPAAVFGQLLVQQSPDVLLDGQPQRLSPGARIRGPNNLLVLPATLSGQTVPVRYLRESHGLIHEVWLLNDAEQRARP